MDKFINEAYIAFICIGIALLLIVILIIILANGQKRISEKLDKIVPDEPETKPLQHAAGPADDELIAVIAAAVAAALGKPVSSIKVRSIRKLESSTPAWALSGRQDVMNSRF